MPKPRPKRRPARTGTRKSSRGKIPKILAALLAVPVLVVVLFLIRYYYVFDGIIEQKLGKRVSISETEFYGAATVLYPGKRISLAETERKLRRLGYSRQDVAGFSTISTYRIEGDSHLFLYNDPSLRKDGNRTVEVTFGGNTIRSILDPGTKTNVESLSLKPELLSNAINENREKRRYVSYRDIPRVLIDAVLASEDRRFFSHGGIDPIRIVKALIVDVREGDTVQGASTLTQQFVKNYFLTQERTWRRKFADAYMSILLEQRLSKEEIFELYCNEVYLGQRGSFSIVGFGEAANALFGKSVKDLTLGEAAMLAGIIAAPNRYAPTRYPDRATSRRNLVLDRMAEYEMITPAERDAAKAKPLEIKPNTVQDSSDAPYFCDYVQDILAEHFGETALARTKYKVYTTLDPDLQHAAFASLTEGLTELDAHFAKGKRAIPPGTVQASLIAVDPRNGQVLAMIGGRNYGSSQFNRITQSRRQPGSIFKPFVYTAALETAYYSSQPLTPVSTVLDQPTPFTFEDLLYEPKNFKDEYLGQVTMRQAITKSLNVATIKFAERVGYDKIAELAHRLGLNEQIKPYPAMAIGSFEVTPLEMVRAYTAFANSGLLTNLNPILEVDEEGGGAVFETQPKTEQALTPQTAFMLTSLLQSVINNGTGASARSLGFTLPAAGKTGTSHDGWFAGYTPDLLCIVWVGFDDNRELNLSGSQSALPIWTAFMKKAALLRPLSGEEFTMPDDIAQVEIDPTTGLLTTENCLEREQEYFIKGSEPALRCFGNNYEQMVQGAPVSIYSTRFAESPVNDTGNMSAPPDDKKKEKGSEGTP